MNLLNYVTYGWQCEYFTGLFVIIQSPDFCFEHSLVSYEDFNKIIYKKQYLPSNTYIYDSAIWNDLNLNLTSYYYNLNLNHDYILVLNFSLSNLCAYFLFVFQSYFNPGTIKVRISLIYIYIYILIFYFNFNILEFIFYFEEYMLETVDREIL